MNKHFLKSFGWAVLLLTCVYAACGPHRTTPDPRELVKGVSRESALQRKSSLSNLIYKLQFNIPEEKTEKVTGQVNIYLTINYSQPIVLDFRGDPADISLIRVNGKEAEARIENEHIILPATNIVAGRNLIHIVFTAGDQSLNRNDDYLYTLLVPDRARTLFPCFDQPDLKAFFQLQLNVPEGWTAVSNTRTDSVYTSKGQTCIQFQPTEPLSTYLFSFVAGRLEKATETRNGRMISIYHRETDADKLAQIPEIFNQVYSSLDWLEEYTGIPYPFAKYELIILPGFQYGGMEHTGATLYNDKRMFLSAHPTLTEEMGRLELIAHETAHMWFGDLVTMAWFDDVWTKEVFANYFAARMTEPHFPQVNHQLNDLRNFYASSYSEDRTAGSTAIKQPLNNLQDAGLIYGQIIYDKAPIVMKMLVEEMGEEAFRQGIQEYLKTYAYNNATWEDLIVILDKYTPYNLSEWSRIWIHEKGMPEITVRQQDLKLIFEQKDPWKRGLAWPQQVSVMLVKNVKTHTNGHDKLTPASVTEIIRQPLEQTIHEYCLSTPADYILPNPDGRAYGYFKLDERTADFLLHNLSRFTDPVNRMSFLMTLYENTLQKNLRADVFVDGILRQLPQETDPLIFASAMGYVRNICLHRPPEENIPAEKSILMLSRNKKSIQDQLVAFRALTELFCTPEATETLWQIWDQQQPFPGLPLSESDYIKLAYELSIRFPEKYAYIADKQSKRITNPDRLREFSYIFQFTAPETATRDSLFRSLLETKNRRTEPWVVQGLYYLNHPLRQQEALHYLMPALEELAEVQRTGDIFFPKNWVNACLRGHHSLQAADSVHYFLQRHPDYPMLLKNKILQSADHLEVKLNPKDCVTGGKTEK